MVLISDLTLAIKCIARSTNTILHHHPFLPPIHHTRIPHSILHTPFPLKPRDDAQLPPPSHHLRKKLKSLQAGAPLYYGWFLNAADCRELLDRVKGTLQSLCQSCDAFREEVSIMTGGGDIAGASLGGGG